ncbi:hypothetical protein ACHAWF_014918 [Thalassiosira exigua]
MVHLPRVALATLLGPTTSAALLCLFLLLLARLPFASANDGVFTYYEDPFRAPGSSEIIRAGPSTWRDLLIPGNQCGGQVGQSTGYDQSPVVVPRAVAEGCDTNMKGYEFEAATCEYADLNFRIVTNGVVVGPHFLTSGFGRRCSMGRMRIPGEGRWYEVLQFHIHTNSELSVAGKYKKYYPAELHVVHRREDCTMAICQDGGDFAVLGAFVDDYGDEGGFPGADAAGDDDAGHHETFEWFLKGWEARARLDEVCAAKSEGTGVFTPNRLFKSRQKLIQDNVADLEWYEEQTVGPPPIFLRQKHWVPVVKSPDFLPGPIPNIYSANGGLLTRPDFGVYTYRGGLTMPPCTEIVRWNLLDAPMVISPAQLDRLYRLILCFVERSSCRHATVASKIGGTNRPPQGLHGRRITHRCGGARRNDGNGTALEDPIPGTVSSAAAGILSDPIPGPVPSDQIIKPWWQLGFVQPWWAILFPWFNVAVGIVVYFLLTRYLPMVPYMAILFIVGTLMGIGISDKFFINSDQLTSSIRMWSNINSEVLLLVFLPGLLFKDAFGLDVYLVKDVIG